MKRTALVLAALLAAGSAPAFSWQPKTAEAERTNLVAAIRSWQPAEGVPAPFLDQLHNFANHLATDAAANGAWIAETHYFLDTMLAARPPRPENDAARRLLLRMRDYPLHVDNYSPAISAAELRAYNDATLAYAGHAKDRVLAALEAGTRPPEGKVFVWKIYNMGFVIRGPRHTVAVDITANPLVGPRFLPDGRRSRGRLFGCWSTNDFARLAKQIDILMLTHPHDDHFAAGMIRAADAAGCDLVLPCLLRDWSRGTNAVPFPSPSPRVHVFDADHDNPVDIRGVAVRNFLGHQDDVPCNVYWFEVDGVSFADNGDNSDKSKDEKLRTCPPPDVVITSSWNGPHDFVRNCRREDMVRPPEGQVLLPAHENELQHTVDHRESFNELFDLPKRLGKSDDLPPAVILDCGEGCVLPR